MDIKAVIDRIVRKYQTRDPFEIVKHLNVIIVQYPLEDVRGFYQYFKRNNIIYLDERLQYHEKKFVLSHELGHMLLHKRENALFMDTRTHLNTEKYEIEANKFAMELLISDEDIEECIGYTTGQLSRMFGYHEELIKLRLER